METLNFTYNWNRKLDNKVFTTLRLSDRFKEGDIIGIHLGSEIKGNAVVLKKKSFLLHELDDYTCYLDTGYDAVNTRLILGKMYNNKGVDFTKQPVYCYLIKYIGK
jgi:hypothetical protein